MLIWFDGTDLLIGLALLYLTVHVLRQRGRGVPYLLFFSIFWI